MEKLALVLIIIVLILLAVVVVPALSDPTRIERGYNDWRVGGHWQCPDGHNPDGYDPRTIGCVWVEAAQ